MTSPASSKAKQYQKSRNWFVVINLGLTMVLLAVMLALQLQGWFLQIALQFKPQFVQIFVFFFGFSIYFFIFQFPLSFYSGYCLEKKYDLSNQSAVAWFVETLKKDSLSFLFALLLVWTLFKIVWFTPEHWWFWAWIIYALISYGMGKLFPVLIVPFFYKYTPIESGPLRERIVKLATRFGMHIENIYSLNLSKTTKKANAMFCGIGRTKRIVLGDTLTQNFSDKEIEMVLAHELGHYRNKDIWKQLIFGLITSFVTFLVAFKCLQPMGFGFRGIQDLFFLPHVCAILYLIGLLVGPLANGYSRFVEREADRFALEAIPNKNVFISVMEKLAETNLADPNPHPVLEFLLYDHPSIGKRIEFAKRFA